MKTSFEILKIYREATVDVIDNLSMEQLQNIPHGFHNSIFWNVAHTLVVQQTLHYKLSGLEPLISNDWIENYKKGTQPKFVVTEDQVEYVKRKLISTVEQLESDYRENQFEHFAEYETAMGMTLFTIEDALDYNNAHEALHLGIIKSMKIIA